jgi:arylsulfatase A
MLVWIAAALCVGQQEQRPNVVVILADDLGVHDFDRPALRLPSLDRWGREFFTFQNGYAACPVCSPTRAAIMTGKSPARLHLTTFLPGRPDAPSQKLLHPAIRQQLPLEEVTIAERLKEAGYATAQIGKWHLGGGGFGPKQQGFDDAYAGKANTRPTDDEGGKGEYDLTRRAEEFMTANKDRPFFLYLCHNTPHIPLGAKQELLERNAGAFNPTYAAMTETLDDCFGRILRKLDDLKLADRTIVVFTSDNGGLHVPEGRDDPPTNNFWYRAGKGFLYEGGLRVLTLVRRPGAAATSKVVPTPVISTDWTPTIMEWCGLKPAEGLDGVSLAPLFDGKPMPPRALYWHFPHYTNQGSRPGAAVREGDWKLIHHYEDDKLELFDLKEDPSEERDLAARRPEVAAALKKKLDEWKAAVKAQHNAPNPNFDAALHHKLYVETDVSTFQPGRTESAAEAGKRLREWRRLMDAVVRKK